MLGNQFLPVGITTKISYAVYEKNKYGVDWVLHQSDSLEDAKSAFKQQKRGGGFKNIKLVEIHTTESVFVIDSRDGQFVDTDLV